MQNTDILTDIEKKACCGCLDETPAEEPLCCGQAPGLCCRHKERTPEEYRSLVNRLNRIEGQIRGIHSMVEKNVYCTDILVQVAAATAALNGFSRELLNQHVRTCVANDLQEGSVDKLDELLLVLPKLMK